MTDLPNIPNLQYRVANYERDPAVLIHRFSLMWDKVESKADFAYGSKIEDTLVQIHYDPEIMGDENNILIYLAGPNQNQFSYIASCLERLITCKTNVMTEEQEDVILPNVLVR